MKEEIITEKWLLNNGFVRDSDGDVCLENGTTAATDIRESYVCYRHKKVNNLFVCLARRYTYNTLAGYIEKHYCYAFIGKERYERYSEMTVEYPSDINKLISSSITKLEEHIPFFSQQIERLKKEEKEYTKMVEEIKSIKF